MLYRTQRTVSTPPKESRRRARDSRAPPVEGGADGCDARFISATNGYEIVTDTRIAVTLVDLVIK